MFLLSATGRRRVQGRVIWLGLGSTARGKGRYDPIWTSTIRSATTRHLALEGADNDGKDAWRRAKERARRLWRSHR